MNKMSKHHALLLSGGLLLAACGGSAKEGSTAATSPGAAAAAGATGAAGATAARGNPFEGAKFYLDPNFVKHVEETAAATPAKGELLRKVEAFPTAIWLDSSARVEVVAPALDDALKQQTAAGQPVVSVFVVYDLPNRDCSAKSSAGEFTVQNGGEAKYKSEFIDKIAAQFAAHGSQRIVAILEPDSLPNIATNLNVPSCAAAERVYRDSIAYAIAKLALPNVFLYLDAAHAGWLGWDGNREKIAHIYKDVLTAAGGVDKVRGFATNVSNYNVVRGDDGKRLEPSDPCPDESTYVHKLAQTLGSVGIRDKGFVVDTSRNGRPGIRSKWGNWCNIKGAGLGERPRAAPAAGIDAYYWVKPPGDSDGTANPSEPRFDPSCRSDDSALDAPQAGVWFPSYFIQLAQNANPPL
jgi:cellulose 1,4-beta-cellobiosidase